MRNVHRTIRGRAQNAYRGEARSTEVILIGIDGYRNESARPDTQRDREYQGILYCECRYWYEL